MARAPTPDSVAALSRDDWEALCRAICAIVHQADGVEDRHGKGNGLDMIRIDPGAALGWQFRRYDDRFGDVQTGKLEDAVRLAAERCQSEDGVSLKRFTVWANIDLEPGHGKKLGERERFAKLKQKMQDDLGVEVAFQGLSWVHAQLLVRPALRPDLFEDVSAQVAAISAQIKADKDEIKAAIVAAVDAASAKGAAALKRVIEQAGVQLERGRAQHSDEQFRAAARSLEDALNLLRDLEADPFLEGRIYFAIASVKYRLGDLSLAEARGRRAIELLTATSGDELAHARGNLALVLRDQQRYTESEPLLLDTLDHFERQGNSLEIVRTLTHLLELALNAGDFDAVARWGKRLQPAVTALEKTMGLTDVSISATGALASGMLGMAIEMDDSPAMRAAETLLTSLEHLSRKEGMKAMTVAALSQRAQAVRYQDRLPEAAQLYRRAAEAAHTADLEKVRADCIYNEAIVLYEMNLTAEAIERMLEASKHYARIGDVASERDAIQSIDRWSRGSPF